MTPGNGTMAPGTGTMTPGTGTMAPGTGTMAPGTGTMTPGTGTMAPGTGTMTPGNGTMAPGTGTMAPGTGTTPLTPYPPSVPSLEFDDLMGLMDTAQPHGTAEYYAHGESDDLYSYTDPEYHLAYYTSNNSNDINAVDILRHFDYSLDYNNYNTRDSISSKDVDKIFDDIEKNHPGILSTMKAYRIPYPIAKVLIKKIIYITIKSSKK